MRWHWDWTQRTLPAPAGPMIMTPYLLMLGYMDAGFLGRAPDDLMGCLIEMVFGLGCARKFLPATKLLVASSQARRASRDIIPHPRYLPYLTRYLSTYG